MKKTHMLQLPERYQKISKIVEQKAMPDGCIYHYTDWHGLEGILSKQRLWLTDFRHLNDTGEILHAFKLIKSQILNRSIPSDLQVFWYDFFEEMEGFISNKVNFFICSFCHRQNYLYAWRCYGREGTGFSIGFRKEFFVGSSETPPNNGPEFTRGRVFYEYEEWSSIILELAAQVEKDLEEYGLQSEERKNIPYYFATSILPCLTSIKHKAFDGENEFRIYTMMNKNDSRQRIFTSGPSADMPHLGSKTRMFFKFNLKEISEIWVGPQLNFEHAKDDIEKILKKFNAGHIQIYQSTVPYRSII